MSYLTGFPCGNLAGYGVAPYGEGGYGGGSVIDYYIKLITSQYQSSPNFLNSLQSILNVMSDLFGLFCQMDADCDLDNAVGAQLDIIGKIIGANRTVGFQPTGGVSPILDDTTYKIYLKAKIAQNTWNGQTASLYTIWQVLFPGGRITIQDNQNMTATIFVSGSFTSIIKDLISNGYIVPRPEAVLYNITFATLPIFGFDLNNTFIAGFDVGHYS